MQRVVVQGRVGETSSATTLRATVGAMENNDDLSVDVRRRRKRRCKVVQVKVDLVGDGSPRGGGGLESGWKKISSLTTAKDADRGGGGLEVREAEEDYNVGSGPMGGRGLGIRRSISFQLASSRLVLTGRRWMKVDYLAACGIGLLEADEDGTSGDSLR
uniref:Uncharacterized protein n=1 Tax=Oryza glumipatula TaxID=40148 RepID=A0A0D9ZKZ3_9ORYZ